MTTTKAALGTLLVAAALAGCSGGAGSTPSAAGPSAAAAVVSPIDALIPQLSNADDRTLWEGQRALIRQCMRGKGFDFTFPSYEESTAREDEETQIEQRASSYASAYANPAWARAHGYGIDVSALRKQFSMHLGPETGTVLEPRTKAALYGTDADPVLELKRPNGSTVGMTAGGCNWDAQQKLYGDVKTWLGLFYDVNDLSTELHQQVMGDTAVSTALAEWRTCMGSRGWQSFQQRSEAFSFVVAAYRREDPKARKIEFAVAGADAECTVDSHYADAKAAAEKRVASAAQMASQAMIIAFVQRQEAAVKVAAKVLASS